MPDNDLKEALETMKNQTSDNHLSEEETSPVSSPLKIPTLTPSRLSPLRKIETIETESKSLYSENITPLEIKKINPHTPTSIKVESPRSPRVEINDIDELVENYSLYEQLKELRYTIISYLVNETENCVQFAVCFDPNGQIVFVHLNDKNNKITIEDSKITTIREKEGKKDLTSFQENIKDRISSELKGVIFYDGLNYTLLVRNNKGFFDSFQYEIIFEEEEKAEVLSQSFITIDLEELLHQPREVLFATKKNYQIIQQYQLITNKKTLGNIIESVNQLYNNLEEFNRNYKRYSQHIIEDWTLLGSFSREYYTKYIKGVLKEDENKNYENISVNMFARFQAFNQQIKTINDMSNIVSSVHEISNFLEEKNKQIVEKDKKYSGKIIELSELKFWV